MEEDDKCGMWVVPTEVLSGNTFFRPPGLKWLREEPLFIFLGIIIMIIVVEACLEKADFLRL